MEAYETLPIVPLRDVVVFPHMMMPFVIGRPSSTRALEHALRSDKRIFLAAQKDAANDDPNPNDIYTMGCVANIVQSLKLPDGNVKVLVEGVDRARTIEWKEDKGFYRVVAKVLPRQPDTNEDVESTMSKVVSLFEQYVKLSNTLQYDAMIAAVRVDDPSKLGDTIAAHLVVGVDEKQNLLEIISPLERLVRIASILETEVDKLQVDRRIQSRVKKQMEKAQKEYYLNEKMKAIQKELGRKEDRGNEVDDLRRKIDESKMPPDVGEKAMQELKRLEAMPPMSAEATVSRNYLDWLIAVPWYKRTRESRNLKRAEAILNEDHYGLEKIKDRILEFLAVRSLVRKPRGTILTLTGPSRSRQDLAREVDRARHEPEVRAPVARRRARRGGDPRPPADLHRRVPGPDHPDDEEGRHHQPGLPARRSRQDVDGLPRRPVGGPARGARSGAEQLVPGSLPRRRVRPVARDVHLHGERPAHRSAGAPGPHGGAAARRLHRDREDRDRQAVPAAQDAARHRADERRTSSSRTTPTRRSSAATRARLAFAISSGRSLPSAGRSRARWSSTARASPPQVTGERISEYLGVPKYRPMIAEEKNEIGIATGLAWTEAGGELLLTESTLMPGKGQLTLTGKLGDVMQESAQAAMSYVRAKAEEFGIPKEFNKKTDVHVHVPEGAIPKDGPSAGITITTALVSTLARVPTRRDVAMTGEITLRGKVLPVGGVKEKVLAAHRANLKTIILPRDNEKDLADIPKEVLDSLDLFMVDTMDEVLKIALAEQPVPKLPPTAESPDVVSDDRVMH